MDYRHYWLATQVLPHEAALRRRLRLFRLPGGVDADDVIQETYGVLCAMPDTSHILNVRAYFFTTARSVANQILRRHNSALDLDLDENALNSIVDDGPSPEHQAIARSELERIWSAIADLPPKCREAFVLRKIDGMSQRDIAATMGISEHTVEKHIGKGLRSVSRIYADTGNALPGASNRESAGEDLGAWGDNGRA